MNKETSMVPVVKGIVLYSGKMLMLRRSLQDDIDPGMWETVGGKIEFGETMQDALVREIKEEAGITVQVGDLLYATTFFTNPGRQVFLLGYACTADTDAVRLSGEHIDFCWAGREEVMRRLDSGIVNSLLENKVFERLNISE